MKFNHFNLHIIVAPYPMTLYSSGHHACSSTVGYSCTPLVSEPDSHIQGLVPRLAPLALDGHRILVHSLHKWVEGQHMQSNLAAL